jgi:hypothetical protein
MRWFYLPSLALLLLLGVASPTRADQLSDDMAALNARWDAAINGPDFDALLPMYSSDAELMPPGTPPVTGSAAIRSLPTTASPLLVNPIMAGWEGEVPCTPYPFSEPSPAMAN